ARQRKDGQRRSRATTRNRIRRHPPGAMGTSARPPPGVTPAAGPHQGPTASQPVTMSTNSSNVNIGGNRDAQGWHTPTVAGAAGRHTAAHAMGGGEGPAPLTLPQRDRPALSGRNTGKGTATVVAAILPHDGRPAAGSA